MRLRMRRARLATVLIAIVAGPVAAAGCSSDGTVRDDPVTDGRVGNGTVGLVALGDSLTVPLGDPAQADADWLRHADPDGRFELVANAGVPGQRTDEVLARVETDVIGRAPQWCTVLAGTNDVGQNVDAMTIIGNLMRLYDTLHAAGIGVIALTIPPRALLTPAQADAQRAVNAWMREHVEADWPGAVLADWAGDLADGGDEVTPVPEYFADGTHFSAAGAQVAGEAIRDELAAVAP